MTRKEAIAHGKEQLEVFGGEHAEFIKLAIKALDLMNGQYAESSNMDGNRSMEIKIAINYIENAKTIDAKPERKNGKWRDHQEGDWIYAKCSLCGAVQDSRSNFCPNCGAEMEGEEESE